jgi:hypothetical protein
MWAEKEMHNLLKMAKFGIAVPDVILLRKHVLVIILSYQLSDILHVLWEPILDSIAFPHNIPWRDWNSGLLFLWVGLKVITPCSQ